MSETPRSDKFVPFSEDYPEQEVVPLSFARELERENAANVRAMLKAAARARAADALAKALERAIALLNVPEREQNQYWQEGYEECCDALAKWRAEPKEIT